MKKLLLALLAILMLAGCAAPATNSSDEGFDATGLIDWYNESELWKTVENGFWSNDPADQMSDDEINQMMTMALKAQTSGAFTETYFVVVKDAEEQQKIIGDAWGDPSIVANEGTIIVLCLTDSIATMEDGHATEYSPFYAPSPAMAYYDAGMTTGWLQVAAASLGYQTHLFGAVNGEYAPFDMGSYQSMARYLSEDDVRVYGLHSLPVYGENAPETIPVKGNAILVAAIVVGKLSDDVDATTGATSHTRGDGSTNVKNWKIWDGTVGDALVLSETEEIILGENEYLGEAQGHNDVVKVKVTVEDGKIIDIQIVSSYETDGIGTLATDSLPQAILDAQSTDVDLVSGATVTSTAILEAVNDALSQAGMN